MTSEQTQKGEPHIRVDGLELAYGESAIMSSISFSVRRGQVLVVMGGSGCGKSTLLRHMIGLREAVHGEISYSGESFTHATPEARATMLRRFGILYQGGALWSDMTLGENVAMPLREYTPLVERDIRDVVSLKLSLVGLKGFEDYYPSEISGGMCKRAGLARAMALDPEILFFDEPSAGLDPLSARRLDDLMIELKESLGTTLVVVTHELDSIFAIADTCIYLDSESRTMLAQGTPQDWMENPPDPRIRSFLLRGSEPVTQEMKQRRGCP